jgi:hypothetical protein
MNTMNTKRINFTHLFALFVFAAMASFLVGSAQAQQTEQKQTGAEEIQVRYNHSTVVMVEGNHLVTKLPDGRLEAVLVPEDARFHMGDQVLSVHDLKPGMKLTETITTTVKPMLLTTVEVREGTIWFVNGERVVVRGANNQLHTYNIPEWAKVEIRGEKKSVFELRKGMPISTTILTEEPVSLAQSTRKTTVTPAPEPTPKAEPAKPAEAPPPATAPPPEPTRAAQPAPTELPGTASPIPLVGLLGLLSLAVSFGLRTARKSL